MSVTIPVLLRSKAAPLWNQSQAGKTSDDTRTGVVKPMDRTEYLKVPVWVIALLATILMALVGQIASSVWFAASIRAEITELHKAVEGETATSLQSQINQLKVEQKADTSRMELELRGEEERENNTRLHLASKGIMIGK